MMETTILYFPGHRRPDFGTLRTTRLTDSDRLRPVINRSFGTATANDLLTNCLQRAGTSRHERMPRKDETAGQTT